MQASPGGAGAPTAALVDRRKAGHADDNATEDTDVGKGAGWSGGKRTS